MERERGGIKERENFGSLLSRPPKSMGKQKCWSSSGACSVMSEYVNEEEKEKEEG